MALATVSRVNPETWKTERKQVTVWAPDAFAGWWSLEKAAPTVTRPWQYGLSDWRSYQALKDAANEIIKMRNQGNKDLTEPAAYWSSIIKDTTPFGWKRDELISPSGNQTFNDARLRELSPAEQASVIASRQAAAWGHLDAIAAERKYREGVAWTALWDVRDIYGLQQKAIDDEKSAQLQREQMAETKRHNIEIENREKAQSWIGWYDEQGNYVPWERIGGTASWRNNNPWNIKFSAWSEARWAVKWSPATDGGFFAYFPTLEAWEAAQRDLLLSPNYTKLDLDTAMLRWSGGLDKNWKPNWKGYTYQKLVKLWAPAVSKPLSSFNEREMAALQAAMKKAEWWKEGRLASGWKTNTLTESQVNDIAVRTWVPASKLKSMDTDSVNKIEQRSNQTIFKALRELSYPNQDTQDAQAAILAGEDPKLVYDTLLEASPNLKDELDKKMNIVVQRSSILWTGY